MVLNKRVCIECLEKLCPDGGHVWRKDAVGTTHSVLQAHQDFRKYISL